MVNYNHKNKTERKQKGDRNMTTFLGGFGFLMMLIGAAGVASESIAASVACAAVALAGALLMYASDQLDQRRKRR